MTLINFKRTIFASKALFTDADKIVDRIETFPAIFARVGQTVIGVGFTMGTHET